MGTKEYYVVCQFGIHNGELWEKLDISPMPVTRAFTMEVPASTITNRQLIETFKNEVARRWANIHNPPTNIIIINFFNMDE